ncbi:hypoxia-inducible factor 1-alpha-like isoform X1 [Diorhabda sublineata]|uniref:hypoxia-inducible factor 1-alpha-like isoform X1 n=1 Tax=Diorhabda sublineata TaxID=1163346 RepID=UPI0024E08B49|nr:hypoxia-inducible factor 1-alpha-like isoform X1 [Diorhabda sublineata]
MFHVSQNSPIFNKNCTNISIDSHNSFGSKIRPTGLLAKLGVPCQNDNHYDYGRCFDYYQNGVYNVCRFVEVGDIEDFMNNEKRKEKSRNAARCRRSKETELYYDLASALPFTTEQISQLDKASVMRLAISYLKIRNVLGAVPEFDALDEDEENENMDSSTFLKTLDGFVMILSEEGDFIYVSENVNEYLGINQIDLMGQNVYEYSHPCDHEEIKEILSGKVVEDEANLNKSLFVRMKCTLTNKGRSVTLKSAVYKVIHCTGHVMKYRNLDKDHEDASEMKSCFISVNQPIPHPSNIESPLPKQTFLTKHSLDMKFTHADDDFMKELLGYEPTDLLGKSAYEFHHALDSDAILSSYKCLFSKGQCQTGQYRFLGKSGGYVWLVTQATLIHDKNYKPQSVVCVNYVISGLECEDQLYSSLQYTTTSSSSSSSSSVKSEINNNNCRLAIVPEIVITDESSNRDDENDEVIKRVDEKKPISSTRKLFGNLQEVEGSIVRPISATSKIFGPRTKDMSRGFLTFSDEEPGLTMLKDEPEDLTHLAPVAGDVCVPLEDHNFLPDMLDDILLRDNFGPLLTEEPTDPFISYRDFQDTSPQLLSPNLSKHSDCSLPSLNSPTDSLIDDEHTSSFMNLQMEEDVELLKPPYISMNITDDLPLLVSNDLMWSTSDKKIHNHHHSDNNNSSLAQLLSNSLSKHQLTQKDHGGGGMMYKNDIDDTYTVKCIRKSPWNDQNCLSSKSNLINNNNNNNNNNTNKTVDDQRTPSTKRSNCSASYEQVSKKTRSEPKEKMSSELLQQLISNNNNHHNRGRSRDKNTWLLNRNSQKAACISQPSDSVLMNLLDVSSPTTTSRSNSTTTDQPLMSDLVPVLDNLKMLEDTESDKRSQFIRNCQSLLYPENTSFASLMDLTQHDLDVNAPVSNNMLQGKDLLSALDTNLVAI